MAVLATPTATTVLAITGCLIAGVPVVPVPADVGAAERRHILTDSGAQAWLGDLPDEAEGLPHVPVRLHARSWHRYAEPPPDATALVMYTSGTTGPPKGVLISRRAIAADIDALAQAWQWTPDDTLVHGLPLFHVHGLVLGLLGSLRIGNRFVHTGKPTPEAYAAAHGSLYFGVPTVWSRVVGDLDAALALSSARLLVSGSAGAAGAGVRRAGPAHRPRARGALRQHRIADHAEHPRRRRTTARLGRACRSRACPARLVDDDGAEVAHDGETIGRLEVRGPTLFDGYLNAPEATAEVFDADGWYRTGDVAVVDGEGMHRIVGRESVDLIKSGGYRDRRGRDRDRAARAHRGQRGGGGRDSRRRPRPANRRIRRRRRRAAELIDFVAQQLSVHKRPREVRVVDDLPRNAMGKVMKKELIE